MSLTNASLLDVAKKQLAFKVRAYYGTFTSLATVQAIALLFSFNGVGQSSIGGNISISSYSGSIIFVFTAFWAFITATTLTTKPYYYIDFSFVTNRLSSHLSTVGMLVVYSFIASLTSAFAGILLRVILYFKENSAKIIGDHFFLPLSDLLVGIYVGTLYLLLFATLGYFIGMFTQIHKLFGFVIPALLIGWAIYEVSANETISSLTFFFNETSILVFTIKVVVTVAVMVWIVIAATNRLEVRK
ncbi:hypothetical protein [Bacillus sp. REN16]|uniref:hypothetical protein n=1 Tax=Bacillus sp. REN16 TaxID=2887296 RepID=UPI001E2D6E80|nr:hypothetical protein [Bacillus sp. REN16]MCC3357971.1 hypothetical protein [Bacillus sp. REN16]